MENLKKIQTNENEGEGKEERYEGPLIGLIRILSPQFISDQGVTEILMGRRKLSKEEIEFNRDIRSLAHGVADGMPESIQALGEAIWRLHDGYNEEADNCIRELGALVDLLSGFHGEMLELSGFADIISRNIDETGSLKGGLQ